MTAIAPTRFDIVGSFLRPDRLKPHAPHMPPES